MFLFRLSASGSSVALVDTPGIMDANFFKSFWISWIQGVIHIGYGTVVGNGAFLSYTHTNPYQVNYIALRCSTTATKLGSAFFNDGL